MGKIYGKNILTINYKQASYQFVVLTKIYIVSFCQSQRNREDHLWIYIRDSFECANKLFTVIGFLYFLYMESVSKINNNNNNN